jgi:hypothetical protein
LVKLGKISSFGDTYIGGELAPLNPGHTLTGLPRRRIADIFKTPFGYGEGEFRKRRTWIGLPSRRIAVIFKMLSGCGERERRKRSWRDGELPCARR